MKKVVTYLYPDAELASELKIYQDMTSQIKAFYFSKNTVSYLNNIENAKRYSVYFLFNRNNKDKRIYVGQSQNGIIRMNTHRSSKEFWDYGIMFTTDNETFDMTTIDYLEHCFINKIDSLDSYTLENVDKRTRKPTLSIFNAANVESYIEQIEFLLNVEGIVLKDKKKDPSKVNIGDITSEALIDDLKPKENKSINNIEYSDKKLYKAYKRGTVGSVYYSNNRFYLTEGSIVKRPLERAKYHSGGTDDNPSFFYVSNNKKIDKLLDNGYLKEYNKKYKVIKDISCNSPSAAGIFIVGNEVNGWDLFDGIKELRKD